MSSSRSCFTVRDLQVQSRFRACRCLPAQVSSECCHCSTTRAGKLLGCRNHLLGSASKLSVPKGNLDKTLNKCFHFWSKCSGIWSKWLLWVPWTGDFVLAHPLYTTRIQKLNSLQCFVGYLLDIHTKKLLCSMFKNVLQVSIRSLAIVPYYISLL